MAKKDKYADREAAKYEHPIPSRELILETIDKNKGTMFFREMASALGVKGERDTESLRRRLKAMLRDGQLVKNRRGQYGSINKLDLIKGKVIAHPDGFGFVQPEGSKGKGNDLFISAKEMHKVLHGDVVLAHVIGEDRRGRKEGAISRVLEHNTKEVVGRIFFEDELAFVSPNNTRITQEVLIPEGLAGDAEEGQIVVAEITKQPTMHSQPMGKIVKVMGDYKDAGLEIEIALKAHDIPHEWPAEVDAEIAGLKDEVLESDKQGRVDLRDMPLMTIDGEDSKDFDDAVYCEPHAQGWRLVVAIADVSHYVKPDTALEAEAYKRATSVYFPGRVVPMLPEILSNGLCSLNPKVDRLCMVCDMIINNDGEIVSKTFLEGLMRSAERMTYSDVGKIVEQKDSALREKYAHVVQHLDDLHSLYNVLRKARTARGAIDFETVETRFIFSEDRKIENIVPVVRNDAHKLIEECMLAANVATAQFLTECEMPFLYRVHDKPKAEKLENLKKFLGDFSIQVGGGDTPTTKDFAKVIEQVKGRPEEHLISTVVLRTMNQAIYTPNNEGHFGLGYDAYAHFTSPIRRYPDLLVHRAIRHVLKHQKQKKGFFQKAMDTILGGSKRKYYYKPADMESFGQHCSQCERRADDATRDAEGWLKCEYVSHHLGDVFEGVVTSVASFGLFIELKGVYVEGMLHVTELENDYYHFDAARHQMKGEHSGKTYRIGDSVTVQVARVDLEERKVDLTLPKAEEPSEETRED